jgi:hypothetical protein
MVVSVWLTPDPKFFLSRIYLILSRPVDPCLQKKIINNLPMLVSRIRWTPARQFFYIKNLSMFLYRAMWTPAH